MTISRRELYALGEPFGECATRLKPGGRVYGGGGSSTPAETTQTGVTDLPDWAKGYAKDTLAKTAALTDPSQNPYKQYGGERIAGFQPLQQQAMNTISGMDAGPEGFQKNISSYMSPYMQNVVDIQKQEANRQSQIAGQQQAAGAVQRGAFGGSRDAIMQAERERNLGQQMNQIQAAGSQAAYDQAANQFRQGITQQSGLAQMQGQMGALQQQQAQRPLDMAYQDFINQQNQPYKQLGYMSDMIRGLPLGQQSTSSIYQAGPSGLQTLGALGMGAYGFNQMFGSPNQQRAADGGLMESYADGGVTGQDSVENIISKLSPEQLRQAKEAALNRRDIQTVEMIDARLAELAQSASLQNGLGSAFDQIEPEQQENIMSAANGGIIAFAKRGLVDGEEDEDEETNQLMSMLGTSEGNPASYKKVTDMFPALMSRVANARYTPMTDDQYNEAITKRRAALEEGAGPSPYADYESRLKGMEAEDAKGLEQAKGMAALQAAGAMLQGGNAIRGLGAAGSAFAGAYGQALQADKAQKRSMMNMRVNLADAQRKERMGLNRDAISAADQARKDHADAQQFGIKKASALASLAGKFATATKPTKGAGADGSKPLKINEQLAEAEVAFENEPNEANKKRVIALRRAVGQTKTSDMGPTRANVAQEAIDEPTRREALKALNEMRQSRTRRRDWLALVATHGSEKAAGEAFIRDYDPAKATAPKAAAPKAAAPAPAPAAKKVPALNEFLAAARKSNPGTSDADLTAYYNKKYGKQ
jgi:hypothetical protein